MEKKSGTIKLEFCSPGNLVNDITEIMKREESSCSLILNDTTEDEKTNLEESSSSVQNNQVIF